MHKASDLAKYSTNNTRIAQNIMDHLSGATYDAAIQGALRIRYDWQYGVDKVIQLDVIARLKKNGYSVDLGDGFILIAWRKEYA